MLHAALRFTDHARADVRSIDTTRARAEPGVEAVLTAADVPGSLRVGLIHQDWPVLVPEGGRTSYVGDVLAVGAAARAEHPGVPFVLFTSFGVFAPRNGTVIIAMLVSSISLAASVFLILEMDKPFNGAIRIPSAPVREMLVRIGVPEAAW